MNCICNQQVSSGAFCRFLKERERKFTQSLMKKQVLEEEMKEIADMQNDVMEEQRLLKEEVTHSTYYSLDPQIIDV